MVDLNNIPTEPGCYIFKDQKSRIIYVGKAKDIRKRVKNYFQKHHDPKTAALVENIDDVEFYVTSNETEALILENNLIKKHKPKYNINLKDSKRYAFIQQTIEDFPRLLLARKRGKGKFYGPFTSAAERDHILKLARKLFKLRTCKRMPKKPCLRFHIGLCTAPCTGDISKTAYNEQIQNAARLLRGNTNYLIKKLRNRMNGASAEQEFEQALVYRDQIQALTYLSEKQNMERMKKYDEDIINYIIREDKVYLHLFNIHKGTLINRQEFMFAFNLNFLSEFIVQFYSDHEVPKEVIVPHKVDPAIDRFLTKRKGSNSRAFVPKIGEKKHLLELVKRNVEMSFFGDMEKVEELRKKLKLQDAPNVIECFDISHLQGTAMVGSMVQFRNAKPDKSNYRRFKIRTVGKIDDFAAIAEVVKRRYSRLKNENLEMPDLIVIDGGKGQLSAAMTELEKLYLKIPIISLAKRFEEIYFPGSRFPLRLDHKEKALRFLQEIRDEAHRFAIKYNRTLRKVR